MYLANQKQPEPKRTGPDIKKDSPLSQGGENWPLSLDQVPALRISLNVTVGQLSDSSALPLRGLGTRFLLVCCNRRIAGYLFLP